MSPEGIIDSFRAQTNVEQLIVSQLANPQFICTDCFQNQVTWLAKNMNTLSQLPNVTIPAETVPMLQQLAENLATTCKDLGIPV
jgi:hypothetical protein